MSSSDLPDDHVVRLPVPTRGWDDSESLTAEDLKRIPTLAEVRCDKHGRTACAFCGGPLKVVDWAELHQLVEEIEDAAADRGPGVLGSVMLVILGAGAASLVFAVLLAAGAFK
jgi:hypothetical protein